MNKTSGEEGWEYRRCNSWDGEEDNDDVGMVGPTLKKEKHHNFKHI